MAVHLYRGATLLEVEGIAVQTPKDVYNILTNLKQRQFKKFRVTLAHTEVKGGLASMGIPQLHIDQLNTRYIMNLDHIQRQHAPTIISGVVHH
jgi:hypothetical protein